MKISEIATCLNARILGGTELDKQVTSAFGADLMSDVLAFVRHDTVLLTGLINPHVIRTAEMVDVSCIVFVRGKVPPEELCKMAVEKGIAVMATDASMYEACGRLYKMGMPPSMAKGGET